MLRFTRQFVVICSKNDFSSIFCCFFGLGKVFAIHNYEYFIFCQILSGLAQSTGWPAVVPCMGNWFGFGKRGFILGVWNSHLSVGNIVGSVIAGAYVDDNWAFSFIVPAIIMFAISLFLFLFLVPFPELVFCTNPNHTTFFEQQHLRLPNTEGQGSLNQVNLPQNVDDDEETLVTMKGDLAAGQEEQTESVKDKDAVGILQALKV